MSFKVVIPARFDSKRFPGKPLAKIKGKPMIEHVYEQAVKSGADEIVVATDNTEIQKACLHFGADVEMTSGSHSSGTDRIREVAENRKWSAETFVVNVQGDSPLISPISIQQVAEILSTWKHCEVATLAVEIKDADELYNKNVVKVVFDAYGTAMYFSRSPIPYQEDSNNVSAYRHLGIYGYTVEALRQITSSGPVHLEKFERLEQLRPLTMGMKIKVNIAKDPHLVDVDTPEDLDAVEKLLNGSVTQG